MAQTIAQIFYASAMAVLALLVVIALLVLTCMRCYNTRRMKKNDLIGDTLFWRNARISVYVFCSIVLGFLVFFAVGFGELHWIAGAFIVCVLWTLLFINKLRYEHQRANTREYLELPDWIGCTNFSHVVAFEENTEPEYEKKGFKRKLADRAKVYSYATRDAVRANRLLFWLGLALIIITSFIVTPAIDCLCVSVNPVQVTSKWSRSLNRSPCYNERFCHVYVTIAEKSNDFIVNFHSGLQHSASAVYFDVESRGGNLQSYAYNSIATSFKMDNIDEEDRYVHWAELLNLQNGTTYYFVVAFTGADGTIIPSTEYKVRTIPTESEKDDYHFITGGDTSADHAVVEFMQIAGQKQPYFAMVGGDIAYDNGMKYCYGKWDIWLHNWHNYMVTTDGFMIPIILSIGNHELGAFAMYDEEAPFYTAYFPMESNLQNVHPRRRPVVHTHRIGRQGIIVVLDSNVVTHMGGWQSEWLEQALAAADSEGRTTKFVLYHGSIYNSIHAFLGDTVTVDGLKYWVPLFEKYNVTAVFENHVHIWKRSKSIRGGQAVNNGEGVVYLGDGAWGVEINPFPLGDDWWIEKSGKIRHIYHITVTPDQVQADALNIDGHIFDTWNRPL